MAEDTPMVKPVQAGEAVRLSYLKRGKEVREELTVVEPCKDKNGGHWYCETHNAHFANNLERADHCDGGEHRVAWVCHTHGPEQP